MNFRSFCCGILIALATTLHAAAVSADQEMVVNVTPSESDNSMTVDFPFFGALTDVSINWGDGNVTSVDEIGVVSHTYSEGDTTYTVLISGSFTGFGWQNSEPDNPNNVKAIDSVTQWNLFNDVSTITSLEGAFRDHINLTSVPVSLPSTVTDLARMFQGASRFNGSIAAWDISGVTNLAYMFSGATAFNQDISAWDTTQVTNMEYLFYQASVFNQDIGLWDTSSVTTMSLMFYQAFNFNQDINSAQIDVNSDGDFTPDVNGDYVAWDVSNVTSIFSMFDSAKSFNQDLSQWNLDSVSNLVFVFRDARLSVVNYDKLISAWQAKLELRGEDFVSLSFHGGYSSYCVADNPQIEDNGRNCAPQIVRTTMSYDGVNVPENLTVTFSEPVTQADGSSLQVSDFTLAITSGVASIAVTPSSISQRGESFILGVDLSQTPDQDQVISVLPVSNSVFDLAASNSEGTVKVASTVSADDIDDAQSQWHNRVSLIDTYNITSLSISIADGSVDENDPFSESIVLSGSSVGKVNYQLVGDDAEFFSIVDSTLSLTMVAQDYENPLDADADNVYKVTVVGVDEDNNWAERTVSVAVLPVNEAPSPTAQSVPAVEQLPVTIELTGTDMDVGDEITQFSIESFPSNGSLSDDGVVISAMPHLVTGELVYQSSSDSATGDSFTFNVNDGELDGLQTAVVSIAITGVNDAPVATNQLLAATEQTQTALTLSGFDPDGTPILGFQIVILPTQGILKDDETEINSVPYAVTGSLSYTSTSDIALSDSFGFIANDGVLDSSTATVSVQIAAVNDAPLADSISIDVIEQVVSAIQLSGSDVDDPAPSIFKIVSLPIQGVLSDGTGQIVAVPHNLVAGLSYESTSDSATLDSFNFKSNDGDLDSFNTGVVSINIQSINDAPVANEQFVTVTEQETAIISLTGTDPDNTTPSIFKIISLPTKGVLKDGGAAIVTVPHILVSTLTYGSLSDFDTEDNFSFKVNDGELDSVDSANVSLTIVPVNDAPLADPQQITVTEQLAATISLTGSDPDGDSPLQFKIATLPQHGRLKNDGITINSAPFLITGVLTYTSDSEIESSDGFSFVAFDGALDSESSSAVNLSIIGVNDAPVAISQAVVAIEQVAANINLTGSDPDGTVPSIFKIQSLPVEGDLFDNGILIASAPHTLQGQLGYVSNSDSATADIFHFRANDGELDSVNTAVVNIAITGVNDAPVAIAQSVTVLEQTPTLISLSGSDPDGVAPSLFKIVSLPSTGILTDGGVQVASTPHTVVGALSYQSDTEVETVDAFSFIANDGELDSDLSAQVAISVTGVNDAPVAQSMTVEAVEQEPVAISLQGSDPDGAAPTIFSIYSLPANGELSHNGSIINTVPSQVSAVVSYISTSDSATADAFSFRANDGVLDSDNTAIVSVSISGINDAPIAQSSSLTVPEQESAVVQLAGYDPDGEDPLEFIILSLPLSGQLSDGDVTINGVPYQMSDSLIYTSSSDSAADDSFQFKVNDGELDSSNVATVSIAIPSENDAPIATAQSFTVTEQTPAVITLSGTDPDGVSPSIFKITSLPSNGTLFDGSAEITSSPHVLQNILTYTSSSDSAVVDSFHFNVSDGLLDGEEPALVVITILAVNDAPIAESQSVVAIEQSSKSIVLSGTDPDGTVPDIFEVVSLPTNGYLSDGGVTIASVPHRLLGELLYFNDNDDAVSDSFLFIANDGLLDSPSSAVVSIAITSENDPPVAVPQSIVVEEQIETAISLAGTDPDGDAPAIFTVASLPASGDLKDNGLPIIAVPHVLTGQLTYTSNSDSATGDSFSFTVNDGQLESLNSAVVSIAITQQNDAPEAISMTVSVTEQERADILLSGIDADGDSPAIFKIVSLPVHGSLTDNDIPITVLPHVVQGSLAYNNESDSAQSDSFLFSVNDGELESLSNGTVSIVIVGVNDAPTALPLSVTVASQESVVLPLAGIDPDGTLPSIFIINSLPTSGQLVDNSGDIATVPHVVQGNLTYRHSLDATADGFTFNVSDGELESDNAARVNITINDDNQAPEATALSITVTEQIAATVTLSGTDADGASPTIFKVTQLPSEGELMDNGSAITSIPHTLAGVLTYTSTSDSALSDSFTFKANDGDLDSEAAMVSITIVGVNDAPLATPQSIQVNEQVATPIQLSGSDPDGTTPSIFKIMSLPSNGSLFDGGLLIDTFDYTLVSGLSYQSGSDNESEDSFSFVVSDGELESVNPATVSIDIAGENDAPEIIGSLSASVIEGRIHILNFSHLGYSDADDQDDGINYFVSNIQNGEIRMNGVSASSFSASALRSNQVVFWHDGTDSEDASFEVAVEDGDEDNSVPPTYLFLYTVAIIDDAPFLEIEVSTFTEDADGSAGDIAAEYTAIDDEGDSLSIAMAIASDHYTLDVDNSAVLLTQTGIDTVNMGAQLDLIAITASEDNGLQQSTTVTAQPVVNLTNDAPTIQLTASSFIEDDPSLMAGETLAAVYVVDDEEGDDLSLSFTPGSNANNHYLLAPSSDQVLLSQNGIDSLNAGIGLDVIDLTVSETGQSQLSSNASATPQVTFVNDAPKITMTTSVFTEGDEQIVEGSVAATYSVYDEENDELQVNFVTASAQYQLDEDNSHVVLTPSGADVAFSGEDLEVINLVVSEVDDASQVGTASAIPAVVKVQDLGRVEIEGILAVTQMLTANVIDDDGVVSEISYQWMRGGVAIQDATSQSYRLASDDVGGRISVTATYTDGLGREEVVVSELTEPVADDPIATILSDEVDKGTTSIDQSVTLRFEISVSTDDFTASDVVVENAVLSEFVVQSDDLYTAVLTASEDGSIVVDVPAGVFTDGADNSNIASASFTWVYVGDAYAAVVEDIAGNQDGVAATAEQINSLPGIDDAVDGVDYTGPLAVGPFADVDNPIMEEIQAVIKSHNILVIIGLQADDPNILFADVTTEQLNRIMGVDQALESNQQAYRDYIDSYPDNFSVIATVSEVEEMINYVNVIQSALSNTLNESELEALGLLDGTDLSDDELAELQSLITDSGSAPTSIDDLQELIDTVTNPVITLIGLAEVGHEACTPYTDLGATAEDFVDGDVDVITSGVVGTSVGTYILTYTATDSDGNNAVPVYREVVVRDTIGPLITLTGDAVVNHEQGQIYDDPGASALDSCDGAVVVQLSGEVDVMVAGSYTMVYSASDASGNQAIPAVRTVQVADTMPPIVTLNGENPTYHEQGTVYADLGALAVDVVDGEFLVNGIGEIDTSAPGTYTLSYRAVDVSGNFSDLVVREVIVADTEGPVLTLANGPEISHEQGTEFADPGASATDRVEGNLSSDIIVQGEVDQDVAGEYVLLYSVSDSKGNETSATLTVTVADTIAPVLELNGDAIINLYVGEDYQELGATATDSVDCCLDELIEIAGVVDTSVASSYEITYNVSDLSGNAAEAIIRTVVVDLVPITITAPQDIIIAATGYLTSVDLGEATADDGAGVVLDPSPSMTGPFESGAYEIVWSVTDAIGRYAEVVQKLNILPLISLGSNVTTAEDNVLEISVFLSGQPPQYPVIVPIQLAGSATLIEDYEVVDQQTIIIDEGIVGSFSLRIIEDGITEPDETIDISLGNPSNASVSAAASQRILISDGNIAPFVSLRVSQAGVEGVIISRENGPVIVEVDITDANVNDTHAIDWSEALAVLGSGVTDENERLIFEPEQMEPGTIELEITVTDSGNPPADVRSGVSMAILNEFPELSTDSDSDGDGISDFDEGFADDDGDNIPNYLDNIEESYLAPLGNTEGALMQTSSGILISLGTNALGDGDGDITVSEERLASVGISEDEEFDFPENLVDFVLTGGEFGNVYHIIIPLSSALPENASYRKYDSDNMVWGEFVQNATNSIASALGSDGACPEIGSDAYTAELSAGHRCVLLSIEDGGVNDADGEVNGRLVDPGGTAVNTYLLPDSVNSTIAFSKFSLIANGVDNTTLTVTVLDSNGSPLDGMSVTAVPSLAGVTVSSFTAQGNGVYTSTVRAGTSAGTLVVTANIDNGSPNTGTHIQLTSPSIAVRSQNVSSGGGGGGGGCTIGSTASEDWTLLLLLACLLLYRIRKRYRVH